MRHWRDTKARASQDMVDNRNKGSKEEVSSTIQNNSTIEHGLVIIYTSMIIGAFGYTDHGLSYHMTCREVLKPQHRRGEVPVLYCPHHASI